MEEPAPNRTPKEIAQELGEHEEHVVQKIGAIAQRCGLLFANALFEEAQSVEEQGGMKVKDGSRRRTPGGVFFYLVKERLKKERRYDDLDVLFPRPPDYQGEPHQSPPVLPRLRPRPRANRGTAEHAPSHPPPSRSSRAITAYNRPNQTEIRAIIERHIGSPPDLYRFSIEPNTGNVTLFFRFPQRISEHTLDQLRAAAAEANVAVDIAPRPHQGALIDTARALLPEGLTITRIPSLFFERKLTRVACAGSASEEGIRAAQEAYHQVTGWNLEIVVIDEQPLDYGPPPETEQVMNQHLAITTARAALGEQCYKVGADSTTCTLAVRFFFPDIARQTCAPVIAELETQTGWKVAIHPQPHQGKLVEMAREVLPPSLEIVGTPSLHQDEQSVLVRYLGETDDGTLAQAQRDFYTRTGWHLRLD
jgi:hypothetical protein